MKWSYVFMCSVLGGEWSECRLDGWPVIGVSTGVSGYSWGSPSHINLLTVDHIYNLFRIVTLGIQAPGIPPSLHTFTIPDSV